MQKKLKEKIAIFYSDKEWEKGNSLIINLAKKEGKIIYG